jgi:hypothetical protein
LPILILSPKLYRYSAIWLFNKLQYSQILHNFTTLINSHPYTPKGKEGTKIPITESICWENWVPCKRSLSYFSNLSLEFGKSVIAHSYDQVSLLLPHLTFYPDITFDFYVFVSFALLSKVTVIISFYVTLYVTKHLWDYAHLLFCSALITTTFSVSLSVQCIKLSLSPISMTNILKTSFFDARYFLMKIEMPWTSWHEFFMKNICKLKKTDLILKQ